MKKDIYIIKNSVNNKVYIGQTKNSAKRWLQHLSDAKHIDDDNKKQLIHRAMAKYGIDKFHYEVLEYQIENYDEMEIYWIKKLNSISPNGYNIGVGGKSIGCGLESPLNVFKNKDILYRCISEISSSTKTFANIAKKYNCSYEVISAINNGNRYKIDGMEYPLRQTKYSNELIKQLRYSLKYETDITLKEISKKYNVDLSSLSEINNGKIYYVNSDIYPLRTKRKTDLQDETVSLIINDIKYSDMCMSEIAIKYQISRSRISGINIGIFYKQNDITYPIREENDKRNKCVKRFFDIDEINDIHILLRDSKMSCRQIAIKYSVSVPTIQNINSGKTKKYRLNNWRYPIRKL